MNTTEDFKDNIKYVVSEKELEAIVQKQIERFRRERRATDSNRALSFVNTQEHITRINYSRKGTPYWFITINPKQGVTVAQLHNKIVSFLLEIDPADMLWTYEMTENLDRSPHAHLYMEYHSNARTDSITRKINNYFKPLVGNTKSILIKWLPKTDVEKTKSYIRKETVAKKKKKAHLATIAWREKNSVPSECGEDHLLVWSELPPIEPMEHLSIVD